MEDTVKNFTTKGGFEIKLTCEEISHLKGYLNYRKSKEEKARCRLILKKFNLPKNVGLMCKSENDICFIPDNTIIEKSMNNLHLKSDDGTVQLIIGGCCFVLNIILNESGFSHQKVMTGTVIKHKKNILTQASTWW